MMIGLLLVAAGGLVLFLDHRSDGNSLTLDDRDISTATDFDASNENAVEQQQDDPSDDVPGSSIALAHPQVPDSIRLAEVVRLADGDSFDIRWTDSGESDEVRLLGLNAPEGDACYGDAARRMLAALVEDQELAVETIERDEFGRVLGNVWVGELFVNAAMVELGAALSLSDGGSHGALISESQAVAESQAAGLWSASSCAADPSGQLAIADIEFNAPGPDNENKNGEWIEIINLGQSAQDMSDWSIRDESTRHRFFFPDDFELDAGASVLVYSGCGSDAASELYWCDDDPVWNNGGDTGFLVDPDGKFADSFAYNG